MTQDHTLERPRADEDDDEDDEPSWFYRTDITTAEMFASLFDDRPPPTAANGELPLPRQRYPYDHPVSAAERLLRGPRTTKADRRAIKAGVAKLLHPSSVGSDEHMEDLKRLNTEMDRLFEPYRPRDMP